MSVNRGMAKDDVVQDVPSGPVVKNLPCSEGDTSSIPGPGRFHMLQSNWACAPPLLSLSA